MDFATLATLRRYLKIKHHIPGRIRISFDQALTRDPQARTLLNNHSSLPPGVRTLRINALARSVVIEYAAERYPPALLEELVDTRDDARAAEILCGFHAIVHNCNAREVQ